MLKKIILGVLLIGVIGILAAGAIYRTAYQTGNVSALALPANELAQGRGRGGSGYGQNSTNAVPAQPGVGQAQVSEWVTLQGTVVSADQNAMTVKTDKGEVIVENRPWLFAQESGFTTQVGDNVTLVGFYEGDTFEVGQISVTNGKTVVLRDQNGRPMWAGRGRRGG